MSHSLQEALSFLRPRIPEEAKTLLILGSGLGNLTASMEVLDEISYSEIPFFPTANVVGHAGKLVVAKHQNTMLLIMNGRPHYYQGFSDEQMRFPIHLASLLGITSMMVTNACGGMNPDYQVGDIMLIEDHINMTGRFPLTGENEDEIGPRFSDMSDPYDLEYRNILLEVAKQEQIPIQQGVYVAYGGPNYETRNEIKAYRMLGGDAVGMSTVPEVVVAKHAGMNVLGLSLITNRSTGLSENKLSHQEVLEVSAQAGKKMERLILRFLEKREELERKGQI